MFLNIERIMAQDLMLSWEYPTGLQLVLMLLSLFLGTFLVAIDTTIISVAISKISIEFHTLNDVGQYGSAYLISLTALQPAGGIIYKHFNIKFVFIVSITVFEGVLPFSLSKTCSFKYKSFQITNDPDNAAGSTICAIAPRSEILILGRAIAGIGAAELLQGTINKKAGYVRKIGGLVMCYCLARSQRWLFE